MKRLIALKTTAYAGKRLKAGVAFDANDQDVRLLKALKWAEDAPVVVARKVVTKTLVAKSEPEEVEVTPAAEFAEFLEPSAKRTYKRKDLVSE